MTTQNLYRGRSFVQCGVAHSVHLERETREAHEVNGWMDEDVLWSTSKQSGRI